MYPAYRNVSRLASGTPVAAVVQAIAPSPVVQPAFRSPRRVTITLPFATYQELQERADGEGRSLSNLAAFLLESSLHPPGDASRGAGEGLRRAAETGVRSAGFR